MRCLVVDAANVVGSVPDGWWRDRAGAAARLHAALLAADLAFDAVVLVLEGAAKAGVAPGGEGRFRTVHAAGSGDEEIVRQCDAQVRAGHRVTLATADRGLVARVGPLGVSALGPRELRARLGTGPGPEA